MSDVIFQPIGTRLTVPSGTTLLEAAQSAGVVLSAVCGGTGVCADCRVRVASGAVTPPTATEHDLLSPDDLDQQFRLACQTYTVGQETVIVDVPRESMSAPQRSQVEGHEIPLEVAPAIAVHDMSGDPPSIDDLRGDWERLHDLDPADWDLSGPVLADLPGTLRAHEWRARMITHARDVVSFLPPDHAPFGFAVDVGTTGLAAYLIDLQTGETVGIAGATNPQIAYGEDVMARLAMVMRDRDRDRDRDRVPSGSDRGGAAKLQAVIVGGLNDLLHEVCAQAGITSRAVVDVVAVGNTAMHHLLLGLPVDQLGSAPYVPAVSAAMNTPARALGLEVAPGARLYTPPNLAGFIGGDHLAMLLATDTPGQPGVTLSLDIGTNTEVSLNAYGQMWSCSTASGPAFEGAHIRDGMRAAAGAIERLIWHDGSLRWTTIEHAAPVGLCGSGILDAVAVLRAADILTVTGRMSKEHPAVRQEKVNPWIEIVPAAQSGHGRPVTLSRSDVNEVQLAKAAIRAGIKLLTEAAGIEETAIDRVMVAGAFGNYIDLENAIAIGMFPLLPLDRFHQVGNAAGIGAKRLLINAAERQRASLLSRQQLRYIELTNHPHFSDRFSQAVLLAPDPWE